VIVATLQFGALPYFPISTEINRRYCERHGLEFVVRGPVEAPDRHPVWSKVAIALDLLERDELVLVLDADAIFADHDASPDFLTRHLNGSAMLIGADGTGSANTGAWLVRRGPEAFSILNAWWYAPRRDAAVAYRWPLDQAGFNRYVLGKFSSSIAFPKLAELDLVSGSFIHHVMARSVEQKTRALARARAELGLRHGWD